MKFTQPTSIVNKEESKEQKATSLFTESALFSQKIAEPVKSDKIEEIKINPPA